MNAAPSSSASETARAVAVECRNCGASMELAASASTAVCPYCALPSVIERPATLDRPRPAYALGFVLSREVARDRVQQWVRSLGFFKPTRLRRASVDDLRAVYLPAYLYSAVARTRFAASIGEDYTETETYTVTNDKGETETRTREVTRTEYRPLEGDHATFVADVLVTASKAIDNDELEAAEPFDLRLLRRYEPGLVAGWTAEDPSLTQQQCMALAREEATTKVGASLHAFMPGDSHTGLVHQTALDRESLDLVLVPVWVLALRYAPNAPPLRLLVNGQTGKVAGRAPTDWVRVAIAVIVVLAIVAGIVALATSLSPGSTP